MILILVCQYFRYRLLAVNYANEVSFCAFTLVLLNYPVPFWRSFETRFHLYWHGHQR